MGLWCPAWEELVALVRAALQVQEPVWSAQEEPILLSGSGSCSPSSSAWDIQSGLIIHGSHLCKFTYSLKFLCNLQINTLNTFSVSHVVHRVAKNWVTWYTCSQLRSDKALPSCFGSYTVNQYPFRGLCGAMCFCSLLLFVDDFCCFGWPSSVVLKCCLVLLRVVRLWCALQKT